MKRLSLVLPLVGLLATTACFGGIADEPTERATAPATTATTAPPTPTPAPARPTPKPAEDPIPARPFGPAAEVKPAPARCEELARLPSATSPNGLQHVWQHTAGRAPRSVASGAILGGHTMNELLAVGGGTVAVQTYAPGSGDDFLYGLVLVDASTGAASEAMPLGNEGLRTADYHLGELALAGYATPRANAQRVFLMRPPAAPVELATLQGMNHVRVRLTDHAVLALGGGALYRIPRTPGVPFRALGEAEHFTWNPADAETGVYWSKGNRLYRSGSTAPLLELADAKTILALGFDAVQQKLYFATDVGLSRTAADGSAREDILHAVKNSAPGPVANDQWLFPTGKGDIYAYNGRVRAPVNCYDSADLSHALPYEIDTNTRSGRWMTDDPAYPFVEGTSFAHFDADIGAHYERY